MGNLLSVVAGVVVGAFSATIVISIDLDDEITMAELSKALIAECEKPLKRTEHCKLIAVIAEEK